MTQSIMEVLQKYVKDLIQIYGAELQTVILYGSYARGDFQSDSDIDIMILVNLPDEEIQRKSHVLSNLTFDYNFEYNLMIMPIAKNKGHFEKWLRAYPFYNNIKREGVELYAA